MLSLNYKDFVLELSKESPNLYRASVEDNGNIAAAHSFELRTDELKVLEGLRRIEEQAVGAKAKETFHIEFGVELYKKVFAEELGKYFKKCFEEAQKSGAGIRICLRFDESAQEIAALPWEFLHNGTDFLVTNRGILISRLPVGVNRVKSSPLESILRMLVVISSPNDPRVAPLNTELEQEVILEAVDKLHREHKMEVDFTEDASFETIENYLNEKDYHIVHFTGHGTYNEENHKGYLILETEDGKAREMDNGAISDLLAGRNVRLVVLSACQSGKTSNKETYADLASHLARKNIPAVVAMQYSILDLSATKFASIFYQALINKPVDLALTEARIVMKNAEKSNGVDFATPVLYLSDPDCLAVSKIKPEAPEIFNKPTMLGEVAVMKKGFVGRRRELRLLQKDFMSDVKRAAIIHGFGGIGKTVLATRLALKMSQYFDGIFGMKFRAATKPEDILNELNAFLLRGGIQQLNQILHQPNPLKVKTAELVNILNQRRFLVIFDNFEDCLNEARSGIASPELNEFIQHLLNNTISNTKFIITTRYNFDPLEGRLTGAIEHISLSEMPFPQTVWLMNNYKELANLDMKKKHEIYKKIGGHPWIIGKFVEHAAIETVEGLLMELAPLKREAIIFTLLDKSYSKLDEKAKELLLRASIYQEAVPVEALMWIIGDESQPSPPVSEALAKLINWGMIAKQEAEKETFYAMHTLVREFAGQELEKEKLDRKKLLIRAAQYHENTANATRNIWNILKAREYYYQAEEWGKADDIVKRTYEYLVRWGYIELAMNLVNQSIETTSDTRKTEAMSALANILHGLGDWKTATKILAEVKELFEKEGQRKDVADTLHNLGIIHSDQGNYEEAVKLFQERLKISKELGDKRIAETLHELGILHQKQGNYGEAIKLYQESMKTAEEFEEKGTIAMSLYQLGIMHFDQGNYGEAVKLYQKSLKILEEQKDKRGIAMVLHELGNVYYYQGNYEEAIKLYQQSLMIKKELGNKIGMAVTLSQLAMIHQDQSNYDEALKLYQQSLKISEELGEKRGIAERLGKIGTIEESKKDFTAALEKYLIALSIFMELNDPLSKTIGNDFARLKEKMGEEAFNKAIEEIKRRHGE